MMVPVILRTGQLCVDPACKVLKAKDYVTYIEAMQVTGTAQAEATAIVEKAKLAYQQEKEKGYQAGLDDSKVEQSEQMLKVISRTVNYLANVEGTLADILLTGVKKIISDFDQDELTVNLIKNALKHVRNEKQVVIRVPPSQYSMVQERIREILQEYQGVGFINVMADQKLSTGDCIMESEIGLVETSIDVQLQALQKRFEKFSAGFVPSSGNDS